jgi:hypothetical protein
VDGKMHDVKAKFLFDTGSVHNYVNEEFAKKSECKTTLIPMSIAEMANGVQQKIEKEINGDIQLEADTSKIYQVKLKLMSKLTTDIVLGMAFMLDNEAVIDLKEGILTLDGKHFEILENNKHYEHERIIAQKSEIMNITTSKEKAEQMIKNYKTNNKELGIIPHFMHRITLTDDLPIFCKPYPIPHAIQQQTRNEICRLIKLGIIRESMSPYCSPAFPLQKKNGDIRLVIDYRKLNGKTVPANFPIPRISDYLQELGGSTMFTQIDLNMGYYQIEVHPDDVQKTAL